MKAFVRIICLWQTQHKIKLFFFIMGDRKCKMCILLSFPLVSQVSQKCLHSCNRTAGPALYSSGKCSVRKAYFRTMTQLPKESVDQFITSLRQKADCCEFGETADEKIRSQVKSVCPVDYEETYWKEEGV